MSSACTLILVGVAFPVLEIKLAYSPLKWKNLIDWNQLKKLMHVGVDVTCMYIDFGRRGLSSFGDTATLKNGHFSHQTMDYSPWGSKNGISSKNSCK